MERTFDRLTVWDFHGVLEVGSPEVVVEIINVVLQRHGLAPTMTIGKCDAWYGLKLYALFANLTPNLSHEHHLGFETDYRDLQAKRDIVLAKVRPAPHALAVLEAIAEAGQQQILITNTSPGGIQLYLEATGMTRYFRDGTLFPTNIRGAQLTKKEVLGAYLKDKQFSLVSIVGDSPADMDLGDVVEGSKRLLLYTHPDKAPNQHPKARNIFDLRDVLV